MFVSFQCHHIYYKVGQFIFDIPESEKRPEDDQDVWIEDDVWIGCNKSVDETVEHDSKLFSNNRIPKNDIIEEFIK